MTDKNTATPPRIRAAGPPRSLPPLDPERLYSRDAARPYLGGISNATFIRLQKAGRLQPVMLTPSPTGKKHYRGSNLIALRQAATPSS